jgi:hypothetical protein
MDTGVAGRQRRTLESVILALLVGPGAPYISLQIIHK